MALTFTPASSRTTCPPFALPATTGQVFNSEARTQDRPFLVIFTCNHCPYAQAIEDRLIALGHKLNTLGVPVVAISSNDPLQQPEDSFEEMKKRAELKKYSFLYLYDEDQSVAKKFGAVCTPDFFLFNAQGELAWRGRLDDNWKQSDKVTREELFLAVKALLDNTPLPEEIPSMGCSIKWKEHQS